MSRIKEDRISLLSDDLIHHILSFIPSTKFHAQTSILSKRWHRLWAHHPNLHFSIPNLDETMDHIPVSYIHSVDRRLNTFNPTFINSFTIDLLDNGTAGRWLTFAARRSARKLTVRSRKKLKRSELFPIPGSLFRCLSIADLTVQYLRLEDVPPKFRCFPNLKILNFSSADFCNVALADLLARCPVLERLEFVSCTGLACLKITSRNLRNLTHLCVVDTLLKDELSVDAPNLRAICLEKNTIGKFSWKDTCSVLAEAKLAGFDNFDQWTELVRAVSNVTVLKVDVSFFQFGNPSPQTCYDGPMFHNLKYLTCDIDWITSNTLVGLTDFIGECPLLEKLFINFNCGKRMSAIDKANVLGYWGIKPLLKYIEDEHERDALNISKVSNYRSYHLDWALHRLKTITMKEFLGTKNEMQLIESLMGRAPALEKLIVHDFLKRENLQLQKVFAAVPRASSGVQLIFRD